MMAVEKSIVQPEKWNRYAYALSNPLRYIDPDGRDVRSYSELLPYSLVKLPGAWTYPRHSYTVVETETGRYLLELTGHGVVNDQIPPYEGWGDRDIRGVRLDVRTSVVVRPKDSPEGDFKFEHRILLRAAILKLDFPEYDRWNANCNGYARWLIEGAGGQLQQPVTAWFSGTEVFEAQYQKNLTSLISRVATSVSVAMVAGTF